MLYRLLIFSSTLVFSQIVNAQKVKSIQIKLVNRDVSRESADPVNFYLENPTTGKTLASKLQIFSWKQAFPPNMDMDLLTQNISLQQLDSCIIKATMKTGREIYRFDCILKISFEEDKKTVKRRLSDMTFQSSAIPTNRLDSIKRPLILE